MAGAPLCNQTRLLLTGTSAYNTSNPDHYCKRVGATNAVVAVRRIALVAAFLVTPFGAAERTWKPFNPVLGETFEADKLQNDAFFVAEQVRCSAHRRCCPAVVLLHCSPHVAKGANTQRRTASPHWDGSLCQRMYVSMQAPHCEGGALILLVYMR